MVHHEKVCIFRVLMVMSHIMKVSGGLFGLFWFLFWFVLLCNLKIWKSQQSHDHTVNVFVPVVLWRQDVHICVLRCNCRHWSFSEVIWHRRSLTGVIRSKMKQIFVSFCLISCSFVPSWKMVCSGLLDWAAIVTQTQWKLRFWRPIQAYLGNDTPLCLCCCISPLTCD